MLGLKKGQAALCDYDPEWPRLAGETIDELKNIFGETAVDIQHIGSTAIRGIKAKPILDIAVGVRQFNDLTYILPVLDASEKYQKSHNRFSNDLLYLVYDREGRRTHQIHILRTDSIQWRNYVDFRDYMNAFPEKAKEYEELKVRLVTESEGVQIAYTDGKHDYMETALAEARKWAEKR